MEIGHSQTPGVESVRLDEAPHLIDFRYVDLPERIQDGEFPAAIVQRSQGHFCRYQWMHGNLAGCQEPGHRRDRTAEVINPDRCIGEDHNRSARVRLMDSSSGSVPPKAARRRDASIWISAFSASRNSADLS
jgi:hypothetical protein